MKKLKAQIIDFNDPKVKERIEACKKAQEECLKRKKIDWAKLSQIYITI